MSDGINLEQVKAAPHGIDLGPMLPRIEQAVQTANEHAGVNVNLLAPGHFVEELSGSAAVNGIPVRVTSA